MSTLSEEYRQVLKETHKMGGEKGWGRTSSVKFYDHIVRLIKKFEVKEMLDYGAGAGNLKKRLIEDFPELIIHEFEPARDDVCAPAAPCKFVVCNDVFEHIEPEYLDAFFEDLKRVVDGRAYFTVAMVPAIKQLSDGRNAHLIVKPFGWWITKVAEHFDIREAMHVNKFNPQAEFLVEKKGPVMDYHVCN
jgi:hypothetical protein